MNKSTNIIEMDNEIPKKNHDAIVHLNKKFIYTLGKQGPLYTRFFCHNNNKESLMPFINIAKTVSANQDDDVWMERHFYKDRKHADEVHTKSENDENMKPICGQFGNLITPYSEGIIGNFSHVKA